MPPPITQDPPSPGSATSSSAATPTDHSDDPAATANTTKISSSIFSGKPKTTESSATLKQVENKQKKREIGGQKIHELTAKEPRTEETIDVEPTEWERLTKVKDFAKKVLWPKGHWKWLSIPGWVVTGPVTGAVLGPGYASKIAFHATKWMRANTFNNENVEDPTILQGASEKPWYSRVPRQAIGKTLKAAKWTGNNIKIPAPLHNISPFFRAKDFVELSEAEKDQFCEKMDKAWKIYQEKYNKKKDKDEQIHSQDVVRWVFEVPKKKGGRFGFRIIHRIPDKEGKTLKGAKDQKRKYKVDKKGFFEYKMTYIFWGKLDLDDLDDIYVESTLIVDDWDKLDDRARLRSPTLAGLKKLIKETKITTPATDPTLEPKNDKETSKTVNNCWVHTGIQSIMLDKQLMKAFETYQENPKKHIGNLKIPSVDEDFERQKKYAKNIRNADLIIDCLKECKGKSQEDQKAIIEKHSAKIREAFGYESSSQEDAFDIHSCLIEFFENLGFLKSIKAKSIKNLQEWDPLRHIPIDKPEIPKDFGYKETNGIIELGLPNTSSAIDLSKLMSNLEKDTILEDFDIDESGKKATYKVTADATIFEDKPDAITYHIKYFKSEDGTKKEYKLISVPLELEYTVDKQLVPQTGGKYKLKYAIIYDGNIDSGHYYVIYQDNKGNWHKNNDSIIEDETLSEEAREECLKHAVYLHYELSDIIS